MYNSCGKGYSASIDGVVEQHGQQDGAEDRGERADEATHSWEGAAHTACYWGNDH